MSNPAAGKIKNGDAAQAPNYLLGVLAACAVLLIWSGWFVTSRWGLSGDLSAVDLTWLRFTTAAIVTLPFSIRYAWNNVVWYRVLIVSLTSGAPYTVLAYCAFDLMSSANASVLINGFLPVFTALMSVWLLQETFRLSTFFLLLMIVLSSLLMAMQSFHLSSEYVLGILLLLIATWILSVYMVSVRRWSLSTLDIIAWVPLTNAILFFPVWWFSSSGLETLDRIPRSHIILHIVYQGVLVSVVGFLLFSYIIRSLGAMKASMVMALVPTVTSLLAIVVSREYPTLLQWLGIALCSVSLIIYTVWRSQHTD